MSAAEVPVLRPARTRISLVTFAVMAAFVVGSATGSLVTLAASATAGQQQATAAIDTPAACESADFTNYRRVLGNMRAAADRHDIRAYIGYRNDLASLVRHVDPEGSVQLVGAIELGCWD